MYIKGTQEYIIAEEEPEGKVWLSLIRYGTKEGRYGMSDNISTRVREMASS